MLTTQDQQALVTHPTYGPMIRRVARQVTRRSNSIYGFRVLDAADVAQDVFIQLTKTDIGVEALNDMRTAEGWLRQTARFMAQNSVDKTLGSKKDHTGRRVGRVDTVDTTDSAGDYEKHTALWSADLGEPEDFVDQDAFAQLLNKTGETIRSIIGKVEDPDQREALIGFYLQDQSQDTATKARRRRACDWLTPEEVSSLQVWRVFAFPDSKRPSSVGKAPPTPLMEAIVGMSSVTELAPVPSYPATHKKEPEVPTHKYADIFPLMQDDEFVSLDLTNDEGAVFNVIVSAKSTEITFVGYAGGTQQVKR